MRTFKPSLDHVSITKTFNRTNGWLNYQLIINKRRLSKEQKEEILIRCHVVNVSCLILCCSGVLRIVDSKFVSCRGDDIQHLSIISEWSQPGKKIKYYNTHTSLTLLQSSTEKRFILQRWSKEEISLNII